MPAPSDTPADREAMRAAVAAARPALCAWLAQRRREVPASLPIHRARRVEPWPSADVPQREGEV